MTFKTLVRTLLITFGTLIFAQAALADTIGSFYANSTAFGYQGTVYDVTAGSTYAVPTPRDGEVYFANNVPASLGGDGNYNIVESNFNQSPESSGNAGFFAIAETSSSSSSITSASGVWSQEVGNPGLWDFTLTVTGTNATYPNSNSRLWRPNVGDAPGGTFASYSYTLNAYGMDTEVDPDTGWLFSTSQPTSITGSFTDTFLPTYEPNGGSPEYIPLPGGPFDTYSTSLNFNSSYFDDTDFSGTPQTVFAAPVPEPGTLLLLLTAIVGVGMYRFRRRFGSRNSLTHLR